MKNSIKTTVSNVSDTANWLDSETKEEVLNHAILSKLAYKGVDRPDLQSPKKPLPDPFKPVSPDDLPAALRPCYDSRTGLLEMPRKGAKALIVKSPDKLVVAFAGTEPWPGPDREHSVGTDIVQRFGFFDPMYRDAAGIVGMILDHAETRERTVNLAGHSLGGGLAQFAAIANTPATAGAGASNREHVKVYTYNPAGLSISYLAALGEDRITRCADRLTTVRVAGDPVSYSGTTRSGLAKGRTPGLTVTLNPAETTLAKPPGVFQGPFHRFGD